MPSSTRRVQRLMDGIQAWRRIGCGRIEAPQPCIGVCEDRKMHFIGRDEYERTLAAVAALRETMATVQARRRRLALAKPHAGQWGRSWLTLRCELHEALCC